MREGEIEEEIRFTLNEEQGWKEEKEMKEDEPGRKRYVYMKKYE